MTKIIYAGLTDQGRVRKRNEDSWTADAGQGLFIVSDGMGGHAAGDLASKMVVELLPKLLRHQLKYVLDLSDARAAQQIIWALNKVNDQVREEGVRAAARVGMGATVVLTLIRRGQALIAHLGDSRAYLLHQGVLTQLTHDHSAIQRLIDRGKITPEQAIDHPARGQITRCIGMPFRVEPDLRLVELNPGDRLLLCTDGLTGMVTDEEITRLLLGNPNPRWGCQALIDAANAAGGIDNIAVILIDWGGGEDSEIGG
jgi:protein phosphatase